MPGFRVELQKSTGDARFKKRLPVVAGGRGRNLASGGKTTAGKTAIVTRCSAESAVEQRRRAREGFLCGWKVSWVVKAEAHHIGRRWKRSRPSRTELAFGLCEVRFGDGDIRGQGFVACQSGTKTPTRAAESRPKRAVAVCLAPSSGEVEGPLEDESGRRARSSGSRL